jgi:hypothetical protein
MCARRSVYTSQDAPADLTPILLVNCLLVMPEKSLTLLIDLPELCYFFCC